MRPALALPVLAALSLAQPAAAQVAAPDSGDTGWMIACALLLLLAALPGLMLRHAGLANVRHGLAAMAQTLVAGATILLGWGLAGYSLAYAPGSEWLGGGSNLLLANLAPLRDGLTVPESAFVLFQMGFAVLAGAIAVGAIAGRARLGWVAAFALEPVVRTSQSHSSARSAPLTPSRTVTERAVRSMLTTSVRSRAFTPCRSRK